MRKKKAIKTISNGTVATQMLPFKDKLNKQQIATLVDYIFTPLKNIPVWSEQQIRASHIKYPSKNKSDKPVFEADPLNIFLLDAQVFC